MCFWAAVLDEGLLVIVGGESMTVVTEVTIALSPPWEKTLLPEAVAAAHPHPELVGLASAGSQRWTVLGTGQ